MTAIVENRAASPTWLRAGEIILAALVYLLLARASLTFASLNASATPVWPPTGLAIALVLVRGNAMLAAVFVGAFAANFLTTPSALTSGAIALGNSFEAFIATALLRKWADGERVFDSPVGVGKFALIVVGVAAPAAASIGVAALLTTGFGAVSNALAVWVTWWLGDIGGAILATPALVLWARALKDRDARAITPTTLATFAASAIVGLLALSPVSPMPVGVRAALAFLVILPLLWAALRLGLRDAATTALIISSFAIWGVVAGASPFERNTLNESLLLLIAFIIAATLPSLALAAERREAQEVLDQTRRELMQAQKVEALGQLTGGVAHDFNNLIAATEAGLRTLTRQDEERAKTLAALRQNLDRGTALTRQLLAFARRDSISTEFLDMSEIMQGAQALIAPALNNSARLVVTVAAGIWPIKVERSQLELAILNLALNARDAMPDGGELSIQVENVVNDDKHEVAISVSDTGRGMTAEVIAQAFEPFFTTKPAGVGTGLGLAQVYAFAKRSGGDASIESTPESGATVTITLPRAR